MIFHAIPNSPPFHSFFVSSEFWNRKWSSCIQNSLNALDFRCRNDKQIGQRGCSVTTPLGKSGTSIVARNTKKYSQKTSRKWSWQMLIICWNLQFFLYAMKTMYLFFNRLTMTTSLIFLRTWEVLGSIMKYQSHLMPVVRHSISSIFATLSPSSASSRVWSHEASNLPTVSYVQALITPRLPPAWYKRIAVPRSTWLSIKEKNKHVIAAMFIHKLLSILYLETRW